MAWQGQEKRRFARVIFPCYIVITPPSNSVSQTLVSHVENLSEGGVGVVVEKELELLSKAKLTLLSEKDKILECTGTVVWVKKKEDHAQGIFHLKEKPLLFNVGIEFTEISDSAKQRIKELIEAALKQEKK